MCGSKGRSPCSRSVQPAVDKKCTAAASAEGATATVHITWAVVLHASRNVPIYKRTETRTWTTPTVRNANQPTVGAAAAALGNRIYVFGGSSKQSELYVLHTDAEATVAAAAAAAAAGAGSGSGGGGGGGRAVSVV